MYLFFDTETTGLPKNWNAPVTNLNNWPRLVQLAWIHYTQEGNIISKKNYIVKPDGLTIPHDAVRLHGMTTERAHKEGTPLKTVLKDFQIAVSHVEFLVAHNINFDEMILGVEFIRNKMENYIISKKKICTMMSSISFCAIRNRYDFKCPSLSELYYKLFNKNWKKLIMPQLILWQQQNVFGN